MAENDIEALAVEAMAKAHCDFFGGEGWWDTGLIADTKPKAIDAMRAALTALRSTTAEPVAWRVDYLTSKGDCCDSFTIYTDLDRVEDHVAKNGLRYTKVTSLYTHPTDSAAKDAEIARDKTGFPGSVAECIESYSEITTALMGEVAELRDVLIQLRDNYAMPAHMHDMIAAALANRGEAGALAKERAE